MATKKIESEFLQDGIKEAIQLFNVILEKSNYNLNQYVRGDSLAFPKDLLENIDEDLRRFLSFIKDEFRKSNNKEKFFDAFESLNNYENIDKFIEWLIQYANEITRPFNEAMFLRQMDIKKFTDMTNYCFTNLILENIGEERIDKICWDFKELLILKKIIFTFIDMIIIENYSRENAFSCVEDIFGIGEQYCKIWWDLVKDNEDKIWKIMLIKKYNRIENKLDQLLECLED